MTQSVFIKYLTEVCGCIIIRQDKKGYVIVRNVINGKMSGVPYSTSDNGMLRAATLCRTCKTLEVEIPEEARKAMDLVDYIHNNPPKQN